MVYYTMPSKLTEKQEKILRFIEEFTGEHSCPPTITEIAERFEISIGTVQDHLEALKRKNFLRQKPNKARGFELVHRSSGIPIYGRVAAGQPIFAAENIEGDWNERDKGTSGYFALRVVGDSMIEAGIFEGDVIKVKKQKTADDRDIVVALIGEEATVKRFRKKHGKTYLEPANAHYPAIRDVAFEILGKVVELRRKI